MALYAQRGDQPPPKQRELERLRGTIRASEARLRALDGQARRSAEAVSEYARQTAALDTLIDALQAEEGKIAAEMIELRRAHDSLGGELGAMRDEYAAIARGLLKQRLLATRASLLLMPAEHQRIALREHLFGRYVALQRERAGDIMGLAGSLATQDSLLRLREREQMAVIDERRAEIERLVTLQRDQTASLARSSQERGALRELIQRKNNEAREISAMIETMALREVRRSAEEPAKREQRERGTKSGGTAKKTAPAKSPASGKGSTKARTGPLSFRWPTAGRKIVEGYGERSNPETGTVTINPGINIGAGVGSSVMAAEEGTVSLVSWLPSYGTIVIVEHRGGYRTVYGNLAGASISRGAVVGIGDRIGTVGQSLGGSCLHFEIWKGQTRLNPTTMLK